MKGQSISPSQETATTVLSIIIVLWRSIAPEVLVVQGQGAGGRGQGDEGAACASASTVPYISMAHKQAQQHQHRIYHAFIQ